MPIASSRTVTVDGTPQDVLELVLDLSIYRLIDPKIRRVISSPTIDASGRGVARLATKVWHLPTVVDAHVVRVEPWHRLSFTAAAAPARAWYSYRSSFEVSPVEAGTRVHHRCEIELRRGIGVVARPAVQRWLDLELRDLLTRLECRLAVAGLAPPPQPALAALVQAERSSATTWSMQRVS